MDASEPPELRRLPRILKDETEIDVMESISNFRKFLLAQTQISSSRQIRLRTALDAVLRRVNIRLSSGTSSIAFAQLTDTSSDSAADTVSNKSSTASRDQDDGSTSNESNESLSPEPMNMDQEVAVNVGHPQDEPEALVDPVAASSFHGIETAPIADWSPPTLFANSPTGDFMKFIDQVRDDMIVLFIQDPAIREDYFESLTHMKMEFSGILDIAGIWRTRDFELIVVPRTASQ